MKINMILLDGGTVPTQGHPGDAGYDLCSREETTLFSGQHDAIATGICLEIPEGYAGFVHPRSGLALKNGITVLNAPGLIDSGYRDEIKVILINHSARPFVIKPEMRIAQLVIQKVEPDITWNEVSALNNSERGKGGFGSTGL